MDNIFYLANSYTPENNHPYVNGLLEVMVQNQFPKDVVSSVSNRYFKLWQRAIFSDKPMLFITADGQKAHLLLLKVQDGEYVEKSMEIPADTSNTDGIAALLLAIHVIATNENDVLHKLISLGEIKIEKVKETYSPSMDIQISSNFERQIFESVQLNCEEVKKNYE